MTVPETDIVEHRPPWNPALGPEWSDTPQARMKYDDDPTCIFKG